MSELATWLGLISSSSTKSSLIAFETFAPAVFEVGLLFIMSMSTGDVSDPLTSPVTSLTFSSSLGLLLEHSLSYSFG